MTRQFPIPEDSPDRFVEDAPIVKMWYGLLAHCLGRHDERIHLFLSNDLPGLSIRGQIRERGEFLDDEDPTEGVGTFTVRSFRNGEWEDIMKPPAPMFPAILQRLKVMASFSLARRPPTEEGRFRLKMGDSVYEIGVTVLTKPDGSQEAMVDLPADSL